MPTEIVEAFLQGMDLHGIVLSHDYEPYPGMLTSMGKARSRCCGVRWRSARGERVFLWRFRDANAIDAWARYTLPFCCVDGHTRAFCTAALKKLVSHYRKLGRFEFARWGTKTYP